MDLALTLCKFHPCWMSVHCGGKCGICPLKRGTIGNKFFKVEMPGHAEHLFVQVWSETWYVYSSLMVVVYFRLIHTQFFIYSALWRCAKIVYVSRRVTIAGDMPHFLYFCTSDTRTLGDSCPCILIFDESLEESEHMCWSVMVACPRDVAYSPNSLGRHMTNRPLLKLKFQILVFLLFSDSLYTQILGTLELYVTTIPFL